MSDVPIEEHDHTLPTGVTLRVRAAGPPDGPVVMFLHGFPEGAFAWDDLLRRTAARGLRAVAPYLRGFAPSSTPDGVEAYRISEVAADVAALVEQVSHDRPLATLVAHDWGGAAGWALGARAPHLMERLVIINSPHPGAFLRDLQSDPEQQRASEYMNALAAADAEERFSADDFRLLWRFFEGMGASDGERAWLTEDLREQYRQLWSAGLTGPLNYYRATPVRPGDHLADMELPRAILDVRVPTLVLWGTGDTALLPGLADGLEQWVPGVLVVRVSHGTHWLAHEDPALVDRFIGEFIAGG